MIDKTYLHEQFLAYQNWFVRVLVCVRGVRVSPGKDDYPINIIPLPSVYPGVPHLTLEGQ